MVVAALLVVAALALLRPSDGAAGVPSDFVGVYADDVFYGTPAYRKRTLRRQQEAGVRLIRQPFLWQLIERRRGRFNWSSYDNFVLDSASRGIRILPVLVDPPAFRSRRRSSVGAQRALMYPPRHNRDYARFAAAAVKRYGNRGTLWAEHQDFPKLPIRSWQVWNEPNIKAWWASGPNPRSYVRLLRAAARAIRRADPSAEVVAAGIPDSRSGIPFARYVDGMYRAGARGTFDTFAVHPYARSVDGVFAIIKRARSLMRRHGDRRLPLWVTEVGWATGGRRSPLVVDRSGQAARIRVAIGRLAARRRSLRIRGFVYFRWRDADPLLGRGNPWPPHAGLLHTNGRDKPSFDAFRRAVRPLSKR